LLSSVQLGAFGAYSQSQRSMRHSHVEHILSAQRSIGHTLSIFPLSSVLLVTCGANSQCQRSIGHTHVEHTLVV
jgi:hypothetical protein